MFQVPLIMGDESDATNCALSSTIITRNDFRGLWLFNQNHALKMQTTAKGCSFN